MLGNLGPRWVAAFDTAKFILCLLDRLALSFLDAVLSQLSLALIVLLRWLFLKEASLAFKGGGLQASVQRCVPLAFSPRACPLLVASASSSAPAFPLVPGLVRLDVAWRSTPLEGDAAPAVITVIHVAVHLLLLVLRAMLRGQALKPQGPALKSLLPCCVALSRAPDSFERYPGRWG